ncbi:ABC transporter permease [Fulvivirgaceae bacterium BMA12]|uniref:ABC transporter permease n=1 Tax=Agaribacillus aureus TaxID=3051825 RepID=A0ABT8L8N0_9BACT|nr:ABC transporter permease [Fulvivirgaceae bacterium BMA12]
MFKHNLLLTVRNFKKYKDSFIINLIGLTTGLACTMLIYLWVNDELGVDKFHTKDSRLYQIMEHQQYAEEIMTTNSTPGILSEALVAEFPEFEHTATTSWVSSYTLSVEELNVKSRGIYVGEDYFNIFSYPLIQGDANQVLTDKNAIVISKALAIKLFKSTENVVGKRMELQHERSFLVTGVFENIPQNSSEQFDFALSFENFKDKHAWVLEWDNNGPRTYATLKEGSNPEQVEKKIAPFIKSKNEHSNVTLFLKPYSEKYLYGTYENGVLSGGRIEYVRLFSIIAVFILIIACINFMNLSTARASRRSREVGIKKAVGAQQRSLIFQYIGESVLMTMLSLVLAIIIVWLALPEFNNITGKHIALHFGFNQVLWFVFIGVLTGLVSGSYPALYLSGFKPIAILKGEIRGSLGELWARRGLVIFQFSLSIILIVSVLVIFKQIEYVQSKNLGYNKDNVIYFPIEGKTKENTDTFLTELKRVPGVVNASSIGHGLIGRQSNTSGLNWEGKNPDDLILFENVRTNYDLIETLGIEMKEGRSFSRDFSTDTTKIIFNEAAIRVMGLKDPIGQVINLWGEIDLEIIGVVKDFHFESLHEAVNPLFFIIDQRSNWNIMARIEAGREQETLERLKNLYQTFNPGFTFDYQFMDEKYQKLYKSEQRVASLSRYFAGFAIIISCLGLFGLAAFTAQRRLKEIGIRKVLGSSVSNIIYLLSKDFSRLVFMAILIALPTSYFLMRSWLDKFAFSIELKIWFFLGSGLVALIIAWVTVGSQALKAANVNPTACLKDE